MIEILKSVRLSKGSKIAISVWFILLMLVVIIFLALRFMSKDRIDYADMIVESEASPQVIACKEKCKEIGNIDRNNLAELMLVKRRVKLLSLRYFPIMCD